MSFFAGASNVKISGGTFTSVSNSGTFVNNTNSNNTVDSYNRSSSATYDSYNNNSKQNAGSGSIRNDNPPPPPPPPPRNHPPPPALPGWSHNTPHHGYAGAPGYGGGHGGYASPPYNSGPNSGGTYNSFNNRNEVYDASYNDNSRRYGAPPPGDRGPNTRQPRPGNPNAADEPWMEGDDDAFMNGPSHNPRAGPRLGHAPYGDPSQRSPASPPGARRGAGFAGGLGGGRALHVPDTHVKTPSGAHMSVQGAQIAQMSPDSQRHLEALMQSINEESFSDSDDSDAEEDKRMQGAGPPKTLSAGIANMTLADDGPGPSRGAPRTKSAPALQEPDEDDEMGADPQTGRPRPARAAASADSVPKKKKKRRAAGADEEGNFWDDQPQPAHQGYPSYPGHPGAPAPPGPYGAYAPHPPPPGPYAHGVPYGDPHFQQRYPYGGNYGHPPPGAYPPYAGPGYGAPPQGGYQGNGNVQNVRMENAFNNNSHVEYQEEADDDEAEEGEGERDRVSPEQRGKAKGKRYGDSIATTTNKAARKKDATAPVAVD